VLAPTPLIKPSPLDISGLFSGTLMVVRRGLGVFALLASLPAVALLLACLGGYQWVLGNLPPFDPAHPELMVSWMIGCLPAWGVLMLVTSLIGLQAVAMMSVAAYEVAQGNRPTVASLWSRTRGVLPRMAALIGIAAVLSALAAAAMVVIVSGSLAALNTSSESGPGPEFFATFAGVMLIDLVAIPLSWYLSAKLLYTIPAIAIERLNGFAGLKRSWTLTTGQFWRTLGYYLLGNLAISAILSVLMGVGQLFMIPTFAGIVQLNESPRDNPAAIAQVMFPMLLIMLILQAVASIVSLPLQQTYATVMYLDQVRRSELPPSSPYGAAPGLQGPYYAPPGQFYGQQGQPYPPPGQAYPPPQPGWPTPPAPGSQQPPQRSWPPDPPAHTS
jgi:hypothetical protein